MSNNTNAVLGINPALLVTIEKNFPTSHWAEKYPHLQYLGMELKPTKDFGKDDNLGVRAKGTPEAEALGIDLEAKGFLPDYEPPMWNDTRDEPFDGRTRARRCLVLGAEVIPCAVFAEKSTTTPICENLGIKVRANNHPYAGTMKWDDFVTAGVAAVNSGEIELSPEAVRGFFEDYCDIYSFYSEGGHWVTRIIKEVMTRCTEGDDIVRNKVREDWIEWLKDKGHDLTDVSVLTASGSNAAERFFCRHVLTSTKESPAKVILFSGSGVESRVRQDLIDFIDEVKRNCRYMDANVESHIDNDFIKLKGKIDYSSRFEVIGVIPQLSCHKDDYELGQLVSIDEFVGPF